MVALACWLAILAIPALVWRFAPGPVRLNLRATVLWLPWYLLACTLLPALLGGILLGIIEIFAKAFNTNISDAVVFLVLIVVLLVKPTGLLGKVVREKV